MTGIKVPCLGSRDSFPLGFIAGMCAGVALLDIHVSSLLQIWSGCWFFYGIPTFRCGGAVLDLDASVFIGMQPIDSSSVCGRRPPCRLQSLLKRGEPPHRSFKPFGMQPKSSLYRFALVVLRMGTPVVEHLSMRSSSSVQSSLARNLLFLLVDSDPFVESLLLLSFSSDFIGLNPIHSLSVERFKRSSWSSVQSLICTGSSSSSLVNRHGADTFFKPFGMWLRSR